MALNDQELTSNSAPEGTPPGQSQPIDVAPPSSSAEQAQAKPVNLFELPDFRAYQAQVSRQQDEQRRQYEARIQQLESRMVQAEESGLDDFEKAQRHNQRLQQQIAYIQQQQAQAQAQQAEQQQVLQDMQMLSDQFGIPIDRLFKAQTYKEAFEMGKKHYAENLTVKQQEAVDKRNAHIGDMGQGKSAGATSRLEQDLAKAETAVDFARILRQAGRGSSRP